MRERFGAKDDRSCMLRFHTQTAGSMLTAQQPENNIARVTIQALAAVIGGTQSLHTNSMDEALSLPTEKSAIIALRTQQILAFESGVTNTVDPMAGSYFIESLTSEIIHRAEEYIAKIDNLGGAIKAVEAGFFQKEIQKVAYLYQKEIESGERIVVGVNSYQTDSETPINTLKVDSELERRQIESLQSIRRTRGDISSHLLKLRTAACENRNIMPAVLDCVEAMVSVGEICNLLREVWGEYKENVTL
jgi:methylmalonyl-CoA mutase N-terminal domain/subunit